MVNFEDNKGWQQWIIVNNGELDNNGTLQPVIMGYLWYSNDNSLVTSQRRRCNSPKTQYIMIWEQFLIRPILSQPYIVA